MHFTNFLFTKVIVNYMKKKLLKKKNKKTKQTNRQTKPKQNAHLVIKIIISCQHIKIGIITLIS